MTVNVSSVCASLSCPNNQANLLNTTYEVCCFNLYKITMRDLFFLTNSVLFASLMSILVAYSSRRSSYLNAYHFPTA